MKPSSLKLLLIAAASFTIGFLIQSPLDHEPEENSSDQSPAKSSRSAKGRGLDDNDQATDVSRLSNSPEPRSLDLGTGVIEALIGFDSSMTSSGMERMLIQMGLDEDQVKKAIEVKNASLTGLQDLEIKHAKLLSDDQGDYYSIEAFPEDRKLWMAGIARQLQHLVGLDRAVVISRMISESDGGEEFGQCRREIRAMNGNARDGGIPVIVKIFNEDDSLISEGIPSFKGVGKERWAHLFKPELE